MAFWYKGLPQGGCMAGQQDVNYLMLYAAGDECTDVTGGWGLFHNITAAKRPDNLYLKGVADSASYYGAFYTNNLINLSGYTKLCAYIDAIAFYNADPANSSCGWGLGSAKENPSPYFNVVNDIVNFNTTKRGKSLYVGNISAYQSSYYVKFAQSSTREAALYNLFAVKPDNWQKWLVTAGLTVPDYASLDAVIADSTALTTLMSCKAAVDYMLYHCTGTVMAAVIQSQDALEAIADSPYNMEFFKNEHWNKFLRMAGEAPISEKMHLYKDGKMYTGVTGGWETYHYGNLANCEPHDATFNIDNIYLYAPNGYHSCSVVTGKPIRLSSYNKLIVTYSQQSSQFAEPTITGKLINEGLCAVGADFALSANAGTSLMEINISSLTDSYYIYASLNGGRGCMIHKIWVEK